MPARRLFLDLWFMFFQRLLSGSFPGGTFRLCRRRAYETLQFPRPVIAFPFSLCACQPGKGQDDLILFTGIIYDSECQQVVPYGIFSGFNFPDGCQEDLPGGDNIFSAVDKNNATGSKPCIK